MHINLRDSLIMGASVAFLVLALRVLIDDATAQVQLVALLLAGALLAGLQIALSFRRARRNGRAPEQPAEPSHPSTRPRFDRRNPFVRELTDDWTGLNEHVTARPSPRAALADAADAADVVDDEPPLPGQASDSQPAPGQTIDD
jgi:hypothetical protein